MKTTDMNTKPVLVLGATGKTGSRVAQRLKAKGVPVREGSRTGTPAFDWDDDKGWSDALLNVRAVYISFYPDLAVPSAPAAIRTFCQLAVKSGVEHLVLLSGRGEDEAQHCEDIVKNAGVAWTILRSSWFCQNFSEGFIHDLILAGNVTLPVGGVREPFIDVDDIADVAVEALTESGHDNQLYELTGPRSMTFLEATNEIAGAAGRPINFTQIPLHYFSAALAEQHVPADAIGLLEYLFTTVLDGRNEQLTDGVQQALGRPPRDFKTYVEEAASNGVWR